MTNTKNLTLIERRRIDHTVFVYKDADAVHIKLLDDSGDGNFVDGTKCFVESKEMPGSYCIPFIGGTATVASAEQVAFIVRHLPMTVQRRDVLRSTSKLTKFYELTSDVFPEDDRHLVGMLKSSAYDYGFHAEPWAPALLAILAGTREQDVFESTAKASIFAPA